MSKKTQKSHDAPAQEAQEVDAQHAQDDDLIVVPKGTSRRQFYFILGLTIFVLVAFMVTGPMLQTLSGQGRGGEVYMSWEHPGGKIEMTALDFTTEKQQYNRLVSSIFQRRGVTDEETATFLVQERLAKDAGIQVTDRDLAVFLRDTLQVQDDATINNFAQAYGLEGQEFVELLRRWMRVRRHETFLGSALEFADPAEVEKQWNDQFREYKFDFVEVDPANFDDEARANPPEDAALQTWFDALPQFQKNPFMSDPKAAGEFALFYFGTDTPATLLEKYPLPLDSDIEQMARNYYDIVFQSRFPREEEETDTTDENAEESDDEEEEDLFLPFEEVKAACLDEAPVYYAMRDWLTAIQAIANDPEQELDFAAEVTGVGLVFEDDPTLRTQTEWEELDSFGGRRLSNMMRFAQPNNLLPTVMVEKNAILVGRATTVVPAEIPELSEIKEDVLTAWAEQQRGQIALDKVKAVYDSFLENPDEAPLLGGIDVEDEAFRQKVTEAGFEVSLRDWRDRVTEPDGGWIDAPGIETFLRSNASAYILSDGQVMEPALNQTKDTVFMVRMVGGRDPENVTMKPGDIANIERTVANAGRVDFSSQAFGFDALADRYDLQLYRDPVTTEDPTTP